MHLARDQVLRAFAKAGLGDLRPHIVAERILSPLDWRSMFNLQCGAAFGIRHTLDQLSILRPGFQHPTLRNLFRVGSSTRPGNGVPLVMEGARQCARRVASYLVASK